MPNCNNCGKYIQPTEVYRREIYVGTTQRVYYGKRISGGTSSHYRKQNVCAECARQIDENNRKMQKTITVIVLVIAIVVVVYFILK